MGQRKAESSKWKARSPSLWLSAFHFQLCAALITERSDVTEELVRLQSHLAALANLLRGRDPAGKKLDFLLQEVHREFNTIAAKSADLEVTNLTLEARSEIEKVREQVQNVE